MASYTPAVKEVLTAGGCRFHRQGKGDHEIWINPKTGHKFPVDADIKSRHTANEIMKQAELAHRFK